MGNLAEIFSASSRLEFATVDFVCPIHGKQTVKTFAFRQHDVNCPICDSEQTAQRELEAAQKAKRKKALDGGINPRYYDCEFQDWIAENQRQQKLLVFSQVWINNFSKGSQNILLIGSTGTGKTMLASIIASQVSDKGYNVKMLRSSDIAEQAKATWHKQSPITEAEYINGLINCDLLVIDEIGVADTSVSAEWANKDRERLSAIIDGRYNNGKPTIFTSNFGKQRLIEWFGDRSWDRVQQNSVLCVCDWSSYRSKAGVTKFMEL